VVARFEGELRFLIVHPSGWYNRGKPWSIPKGMLEKGEDEAAAAVRETREETGLACRITHALGESRYVKSRKEIVAYLAEPLEPPAVTVLAEMDWEIDQAEFLPADEARARLHPDQRVFIDRALEVLGARRD